MKTRPLVDFEQANLDAVKQTGIDHALVFLTRTILEKHYFDATLPVRTLLASKGVHDYAIQGQGPDHKVRFKSCMLTDSDGLLVTTSLYRPVSKEGDPRMWFSGLNHSANPTDVLTVFVVDGRLHVLNLSKSNLAKDISNGVQTHLTKFLDAVAQKLATVSNELLAKLRQISGNGPIPAVCLGSTAIGRSIEACLGLTMNSKRTPDYKGIELKSGRTPLLKPATRYTLFACVPDWTLSKFTSSGAILDAFGYDRNGVRKLYCTVSVIKPNSQSLQLKIDSSLQRLIEFARKEGFGDVAVWKLDHLHTRLTEKHKETFWIQAESKNLNGKEHFILKKVTHTRTPSLAQFDGLLETGGITLDHLIKRAAGRTVEKGPLFKIWPDRISKLFLLPPVIHDL